MIETFPKEGDIILRKYKNGEVLIFKILRYTQYIDKDTRRADVRVIKDTALNNLNEEGLYRGWYLYSNKFIRKNPNIYCENIIIRNKSQLMLEML